MKYYAQNKKMDFKASILASLVNGDFILPCVTSVLFSMLGAAFLAIMVKYTCSLWFQYCGLLKRP